MRSDRNGRTSRWREAVGEGRRFADSRTTFRPVGLLVCVALLWLAAAAGFGVDDAMRFLPWMILLAVPVMGLIWVMLVSVVTVMALLFNPLFRAMERGLERGQRRRNRRRDGW